MISSGVVSFRFCQSHDIVLINQIYKCIVITFVFLHHKRSMINFADRNRSEPPRTPISDRVLNPAFAYSKDLSVFLRMEFWLDSVPNLRPLLGWSLGFRCTYLHWCKEHPLQSLSVCFLSSPALTLLCILWIWCLKRYTSRLIFCNKNLLINRLLLLKSVEKKTKLKNTKKMLKEQVLFFF